MPFAGTATPAEVTHPLPAPKTVVLTAPPARSGPARPARAHRGHAGLGDPGRERGDGRAAAAAGQPVLPLAFGEAGLPAPPALREALAAATASNGYGPVAGQRRAARGRRRVLGTARPADRPGPGGLRSGQQAAAVRPAAGDRRGRGACPGPAGSATPRRPPDRRPPALRPGRARRGRHLRPGRRSARRSARPGPPGGRSAR